MYHLPPMPDFQLVAPFQPTGDQPQAIDRLVRRPRAAASSHQTLLGATGTGKTFDDRLDDRGAPEADARPRPQQDARRAALQRVPRVLPGQRGRVLRQLLRLLPARGVPAPERHVHREGLVTERRDRPAPPRRDPRPVRAPRRDHRRQSVSCIYGLGAPVDYGATVAPAPEGRLVPPRRRPPPARRPPVPAQRPGPDRGPGSASAATRSSSSRRRRSTSSGSSSSATRSSGSPSSTR